MSAHEDNQAEDLLCRARQGDPEACQQLLARYRPRLRHMMAVRLDRRVASGIDPTKVVQEALRDAFDELPEHLEHCPGGLYPWLRSFAWQRLIDTHRRHILAQRASVVFEDHESIPLPDESARDLAGALAPPGTSPSDREARANLQGRVRAALAALSPRDRDVLVLRHLEQLSLAEVAAVLGITEAVAKLRHLRALQRIRSLLGQERTGQDA